LDRLPDVLEELPRTRKDLGYPPLVTPTSQIVGTQAVSNVLFGRYSVISEQVKAYVYGMYGKPPAAMNPEVMTLALKDYEYGQTPITSRPADVLEPELEAAQAEVGDLTEDVGDVLTYVLYPTTGKRFLRWKHGLESPPADMRGKTLEDIAQEDEMVARMKSGGSAVAPEGPREAAGDSPEPEPVAGTPLLSPMPGTVIRYLVAEGDEVKAGDGVVVLEAMKMENVLPAPDDGRVLAIRCQAGDKVQLDQILAVIG